MPSNLDAALRSELAALAAKNRLRRCPQLDGTSAAPTISGKPVISFCSNDYLGLATHPVLVGAATRCLAQSGVGATASRLVAGDRPEHRALERAVARWVAYPAALTFPSGYHANLAVLTSLAGPDTLVVSDAANHASLIDGCRLSRAEVAIYPHGDAAAAARALRREGRYSRRILVTESLFSMDGDFAPLAALARTCRDHEAVLVVDEAHSVGVLGPRGAGASAALGVEPDILIGTFGKALGVSGAFVAGSTTFIEYLVNRARTFLFTTAQPPALAAACLAAVEIASSDVGDQLRDRLHARIDALRRRMGQPATQFRSPIFPIRLGSDAAALAASRTLLENGIFAQAIRPPTVPEGTARLRITLSAQHQDTDIDRLSDALSTLLLP